MYNYIPFDALQRIDEAFEITISATLFSKKKLQRFLANPERLALKHNHIAYKQSTYSTSIFQACL